MSILTKILYIHKKRQNIGLTSETIFWEHNKMKLVFEKYHGILKQLETPVASTIPQPLLKQLMHELACTSAFLPQRTVKVICCYLVHTMHQFKLMHCHMQTLVKISWDANELVQLKYHLMAGRSLMQTSCWIQQILWLSYDFHHLMANFIASSKLCLSIFNNMTARSCKTVCSCFKPAIWSSVQCNYRPTITSQIIPLCHRCSGHKQDFPDSKISMNHYKVTTLKIVCLFYYCHI